MEYLNDYERDETHLVDIIKCRQLLLEAGADPTIRTCEGWSPWAFFVLDGTVVSATLFNFVTKC